MVIQPDIAEETWREFQKNKNVALRNRILLSYAHIIKHIVQRMIPAYRQYVEYDDLMSYGVLGLMDAIEKFDIQKGVKFETYASLRIKGAIIDQIRKEDWIPRSLRQKIKMVEEGYRSLEIQRERPVSDEEVAAYLHMSLEELHKILDESYTFNLLSFEEMVYESIQSGIPVQNSLPTPEENLDNKEMNEQLALLIDQLTEKEKLVITLYYYEELMLKEIGSILKVSESRVSQIHSKALMKLRIRLERYDETLRKYG